MDGIPGKMILAALVMAFWFLILAVIFAGVLLHQKIFIGRTITEIKPNGDQDQPIGQIQIKPFNRISMV